MIFNPNAPIPSQKGDLDKILDTMRMIASFRHEYHLLSVQIQTIKINNRGEPLTAELAAEVEAIQDKQHLIIEGMVDFILYGVVPSEPPQEGLTNNIS